MPVGTLANMATSAFVRTPPALAFCIVRNLLTFPPGRSVNVLDPTAGEGDLLLPCLDIPYSRLFGVEISSARADVTRQRLPRAEIVACAFEGVSIPKASMSLVLCNPPYFFQNGERAEYRIIADAGLLLAPGGIMVAIIPARSAWDGTMINHWCKWYDRVQVWKFPDREDLTDEGAFEDFTQICVVGIRRAEPHDPIPAEQRRLAGFRYRATAPKGNTRARLGWERGEPPKVLPDTPIAEPYPVPEATPRPQVVVRHADEATLLAALEKSGAHLSLLWEEATTWEPEQLRGQPLMPLSGEAHVAAEVLTGLLDGEIITAPDGEPHLLTAFVGHEWATMQVDEEEKEKLREHGVVAVSVRQWQDKPILGVLNLVTGETRYEQGDGVFRFLSPWLGQLAARVAQLRVPRYKLDPAAWELRVLSQFGQDKQLPNARFPGLTPAQQHRVYALGRALDTSGKAAIQGEPGTGKTRQAAAVAARMAYQWRHRNTPLFLDKSRQPAWMRGLRLAWLKNPRARTMLDLTPVREPETGRLIAYQHTDGTLIAPEDAGPSALPVLVTTPKKVTKEYAAEIRAAWQDIGADVILIESHRDIPVWLARCATSSAPAVVAIFPHSLTRAFGLGWQPTVIEKQKLADVKVTEPEDSLLSRLRPVKNEQGVLVGYQWKHSGEWYTRLQTATRFFCPGCGGMVKGIPGKLHDVEKKPKDDEEGILLLKQQEEPDHEDDKLEPVTSRTWLSLKPRWCRCAGDPRNRRADGRKTVRTPLWACIRRPEAQHKHPQMGFAAWSQAIERVQRQAQAHAAQSPTDDLITLARRDEEALRRIVTAAHPGGMDERTFRTFLPVRTNLPALTTQLVAAMPALSVEPLIFRDRWPSAYPPAKTGKANGLPARSLEAVQMPHAHATQPPRPATKAGMMESRRRKLADEIASRKRERYVTAASLPDSFSPYDYLYRFFNGCVALCVVDESHNGRGRDTDIGHAFHQAMLASQCRLMATGTHFGGDILGLYHYWFRFHPQFWKRLGLGWNDAEKALQRYGVVQEIAKEYESDARRGSGQTSVQVSTIPAPGLSAKLIPYLLEDLAYLAVLDVGAHMPPRIEIPAIVGLSDSQLEDALAEVAETRRLAKAAVVAFQHAAQRGEAACVADEQAEELACLQAAVDAAVEREREVEAWANERHLARHYGKLMRELEDLARGRNQAARLAKGTIPRWFVALPCDAPFEVWQTKRDSWGDTTDRERLVSTQRLAWDYLYPLEKRLLDIMAKERAEERRCMVYVEQNDLRSMAKRLEWVLREYRPWTLPNSTPAEDRQQMILDAVLKRGHEVIIVPYRRVNEGLNLQSAIDTVVWYEMALNLFMLDQASRRAWRLGKREEVRIYYLVYANTAGHRKLRKLGQQSGAAAAFAGEVAKGALVEEAGADKTTLARLSSLLKENESESVPLIQGDDDLAQEEADLSAAFRRRARELQAALKAGRTFLGGIEDTLEAQLLVLMADPTFTAPVWVERPASRPVRILRPGQAQPERVFHPHLVESLPLKPLAIPPEPEPSTRLAPSVSTPFALPEPLSAFAPVPTSIGSRADVEFGNAAHIAAFARRRLRRVRSYDRVKRATPLVERDIPAEREAASNGHGSDTPLLALPSLWDVRTAQAEQPTQLPRLPTSSLYLSSPRQVGLWE